MSTPKPKYFWLKLLDEFFNQPKIKKLRRLAGGDTYVVILLKLMLQTIKNEGVYIYEGIEATLAKELELVLDEDDNHIHAVLVFAEKNGLIEEISDNEYLLTNVPPLIGKEGSSADRMRRLRAKKASLCDKHVTMSDVKVLTSDTEKRKDREEIEKEKESLSISRKETFPDFKAHVLDMYSGKDLVTAVPGFMKNTVISISSLGYLHNSVSNKDLNPSDARKVWEWIFKNPEVIGRGV